MSEATLYSFQAKNLKGESVNLSDYKGKTLLIVNTASKCGLTPQYEGLEELYQKYQSEGLEILGFPCNQFGAQEPGTASDIESFCAVNYGVSFPMFEKIEVNGRGAHPLFKYLKKELPGTLTNAIKWNFTKFLIAADGQPLKRYAPTTEPSNIEVDLKAAIKASFANS
ncbi:MAG: glutathione peroxidase [Bacteroidetes bacterium]|nr:glutathione peroxidase [Bacteroidota bacterium]